MKQCLVAVQLCVIITFEPICQLNTFPSSEGKAEEKWAATVEYQKEAKRAGSPSCRALWCKRKHFCRDQTVPAAFGTPLKCTLISESSPWTRTTFSPSVRVCWPAECLCGEVGGHWGPAVITVVVADVLWNGKGPHIQASVVSIRVLPLLKGQDLFTHNRRLRPCKRPQVESPMKASGFVFR